MANNSSLTSARKKKNDEFYTVYEYIQKEINAYLEFNPDIFKDKTVLLPCDDPEWSNFTRFFAQNFETLGLKKLISTSYASDSKKANNYQYSIFDFITDFEMNSPQYDEKVTKSKGKIFTLSRKNNNSVNLDDLEWKYLNGDGDFRSDEITKLRDKADIIITNPPFSLFREFVNWLISGNKDFLIIGTSNAATYKEIFPLIMENKLWMGATCHNEDMVFEVPEGANINPKDKEKAAKLGYIGNYTRLGNACWYTTLDHGRRHQNLSLMTTEDNIKYSKHKEVKNIGYYKYVNCDCIEVKYVDSIPSDYFGLIGITPTFLEKYNPDQFEIVGSIDADILPDDWKGLDDEFIKLYYEQGNTGVIRSGSRLAGYIDKNGKAIVPYKRLLIRRKH